MVRSRLWVAASAAGGLVALGARRSWMIRDVAPELRSPILWPVYCTAGPRRLKIERWVYEHVSSRVQTGVEISRHHVDGGLDAYVYRTDAAQRAALLWIHGGATLVGRPEVDHELCSRLARDQRIVVVNVRYRLAPEHPFPAAHDDCFAALQWLHGSTGTLGIDPARIAVGGASAGGGLAAGVAQHAADAGIPVAFQLLLYPMLDDRTTSPLPSGRGRLSWTAHGNAFAWASFLGEGHEGRALPDYASASRRDDLRGQPPAWIGVGDLDLFYEESLAYAARLREAGVPVELVVVPGMYHAADYFKRDTASMRLFRQSMYDATGRALEE